MAVSAGPPFQPSYMRSGRVAEHALLIGEVLNAGLYAAVQSNVDVESALVKYGLLSGEWAA